MALTQRLEFRQSQALVMTPQLMQAIKLLQLSNLDLSAYVEGELERNPLLERPARARARPSQPARGREAAPRHGEAQETEWPKADVNGSAAIEDSFDTGIENVFPDAGEAPQRPAPSRACRLFGMGRRRLGRTRGRRLQSRSLRVGRERRSPITWPSSSRSRSPIRCAA